MLRLVALRNGTVEFPANITIHAWKILIDLVREFVVIYVLARLVSGLGIVDWKGALNLGFWAWLGFPVQMLVGASLWVTSHGLWT